MKLVFQWYGFSHGQWCYFLLADMWFVFILHSYTWDLSEHSCLFPLFSSIMKLQGQRVYVFYTLIDADKLFPKWLCHHVLPLILLWVPFSPDLHHHQILPIKNILPAWWTKEILFFFFLAICIFLFELSVHILPPFFCQVACLFFLMSMKGLFVYSGLRRAGTQELDCVCLNSASVTYQLLPWVSYLSCTSISSSVAWG